jgi:hypothetical protein
MIPTKSWTKPLTLQAPPSAVFARHRKCSVFAPIIRFQPISSEFPPAESMRLMNVWAEAMCGTDSLSTWRQWKAENPTLMK